MPVNFVGYYWHREVKVIGLAFAERIASEVRKKARKFS